MTDELDKFARRIQDKGFRLDVDADTLPEPRRPARTDALFHLPLLALAILVISKTEVLTSSRVGGRVAHLLIEYFQSLRDIRTLEWSITLRRRCAEALAFLEKATLVQVQGSELRAVDLTPRGRELLTRGLQDETDVGQLLRGLIRAQARASLRRGPA